MTQELKLKKLTDAKRFLQDAEVSIHDAGVMHDDAMSISTNRFAKLRENVNEFVKLIEECEHSIRMEKPKEIPVEEAQSSTD
jgi:hypothetical protein